MQCSAPSASQPHRTPRPHLGAAEAGLGPGPGPGQECWAGRLETRSSPASRSISPPESIQEGYE